MAKEFVKKLVDHMKLKIIIYKVVARKAKKFVKQLLFLQRLTFTKFLKGVCYITFINGQIVVCAFQSSILTKKSKLV